MQRLRTFQYKVSPLNRSLEGGDVAGKDFVDGFQK
jgi:hypothetical protein